jgi:hypothetical protein
VIPETVLGFPNPIGVARPVYVFQAVVIAGTLGGITYHDGDRGSQGSALKNAGKDLGLVRLRPGGSGPPASRTAAVQFAAYILHGKRDAGGTAVNDTAQSGTVGFPEGSDGKNRTKSVPPH